jgi:hypothetical protein
VSVALRNPSRLPLEELWDDHGRVEAEMVGPAGAERIKQLLRSGEMSFVIADVGKPLRWISEKDAASFWKTEVKDHLADGERAYLDDFPGGYAFFATEWRRLGGCAVIVLEVQH